MLSFNKKNNNEVVADSANGPIYLSTKEGKKSILAKNTRITPSETKKGEQKKRDVIGVFGPSNAGKSHIVNQFIADYHNKYPKRNIFFFGPFEDDPTITNMKYVDFIDQELVDEFHGDRFPLETFKNSLVVFDDVASFRERALKHIYRIVEKLCITGRHVNASVIITSHNLLSGSSEAGKVIKNELTTAVIFPLSNFHQSSTFLKNYIGLDKRTIEDIRNVKSRWVAIKKTYPQVVITQLGVQIV